jgi:hypothetical protein
MYNLVFTWLWFVATSLDGWPELVRADMELIHLFINSEFFWMGPGMQLS